MAKEKEMHGKEAFPEKKRERRDDPTHLPGPIEKLLQELHSEGQEQSEEKTSRKRGKSVSKGSKPKGSKKKSLFRRFFTKLFLWLLLLAIILVAALFLWQKFSTVEVEKKYALVSQELQRCSELTTVKITYSDIVTLKKSAVMGLAKSYSSVKFSGVIRCGIENLGDSRMYIDQDGKGITLRIPAAKVLGNDIQEISVFDEQQSIFVPITTQEVLDQVDFAREDTLQKMLDSGILAESEQQARALLTTILSNMGFQQIDIQN